MARECLRIRPWNCLVLGVIVAMLVVAMHDVFGTVRKSNWVSAGVIDAARAFVVQEREIPSIDNQAGVTNASISYGASGFSGVQQAKPTPAASLPSRSIVGTRLADSNVAGNKSRSEAKKDPSIWRGVRLMEPNTRPIDDPRKYRTGGPVWPPGSASSYDWKQAIMKLYHVPVRQRGLKETIFALDPSRRQPCGKSCVAHCLAGQPRDMVDIKGLWKGAKHYLFDVMSEARVIFAVLPISEMRNSAVGEGTVGFVRSDVGGVSAAKLVEAMKYMDVDRALFLDEACNSGKCLSKQSGIVCVAKLLGVKALYDTYHGVIANFCDVQFRRFQTCVNLVREYEESHSMTFAWVTRQRPDTYWVGPAGNLNALKLDQNLVYLHSWAACGYGGADWFYFMGRRIADIFARFPDEFSCQHYKRKGILPNPCKGCLGCECSLVAWLLTNNVSFMAMPFSQYTVAKFCGAGCAPDFKPVGVPIKLTNLTGYAQRT